MSTEYVIYFTDSNDNECEVRLIGADPEAERYYLESFTNNPKTISIKRVERVEYPVYRPTINQKETT